MTSLHEGARPGHTARSRSVHVLHASGGAHAAATGGPGLLHTRRLGHRSEVTLPAALMLHADTTDSGRMADPVGSPLTAARRAAGLTMTELARSVHVTRPTLARWERSSWAVPRHHWQAIARALEVDLSEVGDLFADRRPSRLDGTILPSLAWARRSSGLTQRQLAGRVGVATTTLAMWESAGVRVPLGVETALADELGTIVAALAAAAPGPGPETRPLRRLRQAAGMSVLEAAALLGVSASALYRYEAGERQAPIAVFRRMTTVYRASAKVLLDCGMPCVPIPAGTRWRPDELPAAVTALRTTAGLSKVELGRLLGRSGQAVRSWEIGRTRPPPGMCRRLEVVFGLSVGRLPY